MTLRIIIDRKRCIGAGNCVYLAPTAYQWRQGDLLKPEVLDPSTVEEDVIYETAAACPTQAIVVEQVQDPS